MPANESPLPDSMRALIHNQKDQSLILTTTTLPVPEPDHHLLRVRATTLSAGELLWKSPRSDTSSVPGVDVAACVVSAPPTSRFVPGDEVYARTNFFRPGSARDFSVATEQELALCPKNLSPEEAATVPMSALTAWQALFDRGGLPVPRTSVGEEARNETSEPKKRVLVTGASGGVGVWAVQLAKLAGASVVGTCGPSKVELVSDLGADEALDYTKISLAEWVEEDSDRKFDLVLDCVGGGSMQETWVTLKDGGLLLTIVASDYKEELERPDGISKSVKGRFFIMHPDGTQLQTISGLIEAGRCKPVVDSIWEFQDWEKALQVVDGGHARGKVVLKIGN